MNMPELINHVHNAHGKLVINHSYGGHVIMVYFENAADACAFKLVTGFDGTVVDAAAFARIKEVTGLWR